MVQSETELITWLDGDEAKSRPYRARRLARLLEVVIIPSNGIMFWGGSNSAQCFSELRLAFIHGLYLSTVLLVLAFIEQEIAGLLHAGGWDEARSAPLEKLLREARQRSVISEGEFKSFERLRDVRNAYAHFRHFDHPTAWHNRAMSAETDLDGILESDVDVALQALGTFLSRQSKARDFL